MWQNFLCQLPNIPHLEFESFVRSIRTNGATTPQILDCEEEFCPISILADREARPYLPPEPVPPAWLKGDTEAPFTINKSRDVRVEVHGKNQGRRVMEPDDSIQGSHPLSRYGDCQVTILPSVLPATACMLSVGLHRFEPVARPGSLQARAMLLTRQGTSLWHCYSQRNSPRGWSFLPASACRHAARTISSPLFEAPGV